MLINALVSVAIAIGAYFGFDLGDEALMTLLTALFGANIAVNRGVVTAPDTVEQLKQEAATNAQNATMARVTKWANEQAAQHPVTPEPTPEPPGPPVDPWGPLNLDDVAPNA